MPYPNKKNLAPKFIFPLILLISSFITLTAGLYRPNVFAQSPYGDGNVLCSNGEYGDGSYPDNGDCEAYGSSVTVLPIEVAEQCASLGTPAERVDCAQKISASGGGGSGGGGAGSSKVCGAPDQNPVTVGVNIGCRGEGNPIFDMIGAIVRFLSVGVGLVIVLMIIISGIRYITSSGNPEALQGAKKMLTNAVIALLLFIFAAAILNFLVPGGLLEF